MQNKTKHIITVRNEFENISLSCQDICFIECQAHYSVIHTNREKIVSETPFNEIVHDLPTDCFIQTHENFVVARRSIKLSNNKTIVLTGNRNIPVDNNYRIKNQSTLAS